eukprot:234673-Chlamydomonas_euryale.AAC.1
MDLHEFVSGQAPPEVHGSLAEVGVRLNDKVCGDDGDFFPKFTAEDIEVPPDDERGGNWFKSLFTRGIDGVRWTAEEEAQFAEFEAMVDNAT